MQVPKHFWGDAVLTVCHLINRMPSVVLNQESPFSVLYPKRTPFSLTPRVLPLFMSLILVLDTLVLKRAIVVTVLSLVDILLMLMLPFLSPPHSFPHLVNVCLLISSLVIRGRVPFRLLFFQFLCFLHLRKYLWLPHLTLLCKFISDLKIGALYLIAPILHLLCQRFLLPHPLFLRLMIYLLLYDEVNVLVLNTQLLIFCLIIVFHLVYILLLVLCPLSLFLPLISRPYLRLDENVQWMRK